MYVLVDIGVLIDMDPARLLTLFIMLSISMSSFQNQIFQTGLDTTVTQLRRVSVAARKVPVVSVTNPKG